MIQKGEMYAIIPARAGSKGVKNKNIRCVKGYPLLAYAIAAAKCCKYISRILVSTDSEEYARIARYYGSALPAAGGAGCGQFAGYRLHGACDRLARGA